MEKPKQKLIGALLPENKIEKTKPGEPPSMFSFYLTIDRATLHVEKVGFILSDEEYFRIAEEKRASLRDLANKVGGGKPLTDRERVDASFLIFGAAETLSEKPSRARGHKSQFDAWSVVLTVEVAKRSGLSRNRAIEGLAEMHDVSVEAVRKAIRMHGRDVAQYVDDHPSLLLKPKQIAALRGTTKSAK